MAPWMTRPVAPIEVEQPRLAALRGAVPAR